MSKHFSVKNASLFVQNHLLSYRFGPLPLIVSVFAIAAVAITFSVTSGQDKRKELKPLEQIFLTTPIPLASEESDPQKHTARQIKNRRFHYPRGENLNEQKPGEVYARSSEAGFSAPIPYLISDLVLVGRVIKAQPYLSEPNTVIYSEFTVQVEEIIKPDQKFPVSVNSSVIALREGGAMQMPDGRVLRYFATNTGSLPQQGQRYTLFLSRNPEVGEYSIITGYELAEGRVIPLEPSSNRQSYADLSEESFLLTLRDFGF
jgi:hypothetical protein